MFDYMARSFLSVLKPLLEESEQWDEDISQAWQSLFQLITFGIQRGYSQSVSSPITKDDEEEILVSGADNLIPDSTDNEETWECSKEEKQRHKIDTHEQETLVYSKSVSSH